MASSMTHNNLLARLIMCYEIKSHPNDHHLFNERNVKQKNGRRGERRTDRGRGGERYGSREI